MNQPLTLSLAVFVDELQEDLSRLTLEHPKGITYRVLKEEYGETMPRLLKATRVLEQNGIIRIYDAVVPYILPATYEPISTRPYQDLSELQRKTFMLLAKSTSATNGWLVRTNYYQISRLVECSAGGARSTIERLQALQYVKVVQLPEQGQANSLVLEVAQDKIAVAQEKPT
jgi:hypothetical protein